MIYFDNASTTNKKPFSVKLATLKAISKKFCSNPGRSSHKYSINSANVVFETRLLLHQMFNNDSAQNVVFTSGCTEALNTAILGTAKQGGHVLITTNEHNSVARPLMQLKEKGILDFCILETEKDGTVSTKKILNNIKENTYLVIVNQTSNVTGATSNITEIGNALKDKNILFMVDGAQSGGHQQIDMKRDNINILCLAGHKGLLATQGVGVLLFDSSVNIKPLKFGGTGTHSENLLPPISYPESLEAGTSATPAIFSLNAGLKYVKKNFDKINNKIHELTKQLLNNLSEIKEVVLYTKNNCYNGVVSFRLTCASVSEVVNYFNEHHFCIRGGLHCAPLCHKKQGTLDGGTIRVSLSSSNTSRQIKRFVSLLKKFIEKSHA